MPEGAFSVAALRFSDTSEIQLVERNEALFRLRVDVRDHLDIGLETRADELRLQEPVDLVDAGGVVHPDRDADRFLAVRDLDLLDRGRGEGVDADTPAL